MSKKRMLADVLWEAANKRLWSGRQAYAPLRNRWRYSCDSVCVPYRSDERVKIKEWLRALGCDTQSLWLFDEFKEGEERQGVRYLWLLLAMHCAEDENIEIEVSE